MPLRAPLPTLSPVHVLHPALHSCTSLLNFTVPDMNSLRPHQVNISCPGNGRKVNLVFGVQVVPPEHGLSLVGTNLPAPAEVNVERLCAPLPRSRVSVVERFVELAGRAVEFGAAFKDFPHLTRR